MRSWLKAIREHARLSQSEISEKISMSQASYCNIENGERNPSVQTAKKIAEALDFKEHGYDWTIFFDNSKSCSGV